MSVVSQCLQACTLKGVSESLRFHIGITPSSQDPLLLGLLSSSQWVLVVIASTRVLSKQVGICFPTAGAKVTALSGCCYGVCGPEQKSTPSQPNLLFALATCPGYIACVLGPCEHQCVCTCRTLCSRVWGRPCSEVPLESAVCCMSVCIGGRSTTRRYRPCSGVHVDICVGLGCLAGSIRWWQLGRHRDMFVSG